jgi:hypothetical protein
MRKLALLTLTIYLATVSAFFSPLAFADEEDNDSETFDERIEEAMCQIQGVTGESSYTYKEGEGEGEGKDEEDFNAILVAIEEHIESSKDSEYCGVTNEATGYVEIGDCTTAGELITEISEVIADPTDLTDSETRIINVYHGVCCFVGKEKSNGKFECEDIRDVYFEEYSECDDKAISCEKRQWIIATSGAGIIKVYVKQIYRWAATTVGLVAVVTIVINGIRISVSGVSGDISDAKNKILKALGGLVLLFFSAILLYTINPTFFS